MLHQHNSEREKSPVDWTLQITRDVLGDKEQRTIERARERKKWTLNVQRKQHFARITIFHVRAHNGNVMNFLISISTIYLSIFFMSTVSVLLASWCRQHRARICWRTYFGIVMAFMKLLRDHCTRPFSCSQWLQSKMFFKCPIYTSFHVFCTRN